MSSQTIHLVFRQLSNKESADIANDVKIGGIIFSNIELPLDYSSFPSELSKNSAEKLFSRVQSIVHAPINGGDSSLKVCSYKGFYPIYILRSNAFRNCLNASFELDAIQWVQENHPEYKIQIYTQEDSLNKLELGSEIQICNEGLSNAQGGGNSKIAYAFVVLLRFLIGFIQCFRPSLGKNLVWYTDVQPVRIIGLDGKERLGDPIFEYLVDRIHFENEFSLLSVLKNYNNRDTYSVKKDVFEPVLKKRGLFFEFFLGLALIQTLLGLNDVRSYRKKVKLAFQTKRFDDFSFHDQLILNFIRKQADQLVLMVTRYEASTLLFRLLKPSAVGGGNELSFSKYPIVGAAKEYGINTFGIQHGGISGQNVFYSFIDADKKFNPCPDLTLTWGKYVLDRLCENSIYRQDQVKVVGQIRTDVIPILKDIGHQNLSKKFSVLYCGQPLPHIPVIREKLLRDLFRLQANHPNIELLIKPHPREMHELDWIRSLAQSENTEAKFKTDDLYLLLSQTDAVITYYSTAGAEAIYFDKELIVFDYDGADIAGYNKLGVGHLCKDYDALVHTLKEIQSGCAADLSNARARFREERVFKIDGQTVRRTLDTIKSL